MAIHDHHPFENSIFNHFREEEAKIHFCIETLTSYKYKVIDLENQIIDEHNVDKLDKRYSFNYKRVPKRSYEETHKNIS